MRSDQRRILLEKIELEGVLRDVELELRRTDGKVIVVVENSRAVRDLTGRFVYCEGTLTDITERKKAEQEAREYTRQVEEARQQLAQQASQLLEQSFDLAEARNTALQASRLKSEFLACRSCCSIRGWTASSVNLPRRWRYRRGRYWMWSMIFSTIRA